MVVLITDMGVSDISLDYDSIFKIIAIGDGGCGKTALMVRFTTGRFQEQYQMTIGVSFAVKKFEVSGRRVALHVWDTGGQQQFVHVRPLYYRGAAGALCVFDLSNRESFEHVPQWVNELYTVTGQVPLILVGNKADLPNREVTKDEGVALAQKLGLQYLESSAKTGEKVTDCFHQLAMLMLTRAPLISEHSQVQKS